MFIVRCINQSKLKCKDKNIPEDLKSFYVFFFYALFFGAIFKQFVTNFHSSSQLCHESFLAKYSKKISSEEFLLVFKGRVVVVLDKNKLLGHCLKLVLFAAVRNSSIEPLMAKRNQR